MRHYRLKYFMNDCTDLYHVTIVIRYMKYYQQNFLLNQSFRIAIKISYSKLGKLAKIVRDTIPGD